MDAFKKHAILAKTGWTACMCCNDVTSQRAKKKSKRVARKKLKKDLKNQIKNNTY